MEMRSGETAGFTRSALDLPATLSVFTGRSRPARHRDEIHLRRHKLRLQKGLNPKHMAVRVVNSARNTTHESGIIAHSCRLGKPRELPFMHARVVTANGLSLALGEHRPCRAGQNTGTGGVTM
jgi:hypothetical protein